MLRRLAKLVLGNYALYRIYRSTSDSPSRSATPGDTTGTGSIRVALLDDMNELIASPHADLRPLAAYAGDEARLYGIWHDGVLAGAAAYWWGQRYATRGFWRLLPHDAKLVQLNVASALRGRGLAVPLVAASSAAMRALGHATLYARVWHNLRASRAAFERAGWQNFAFVIEADPFRRGTPSRWTIPVRPKDRASPRGAARVAQLEAGVAVRTGTSAEIAQYRALQRSSDRDSA